MKHKLFIVTLLVVMGIGSVIAQSSRRIQRIDREIQKTVFIPKGTWMAGGTVSYSEHNESNLNFLVLKDIEGKGYDFSVSPYFGYFFRDNISMGARFSYKRNYLDLGNFDLNLGEDFKISLKIFIIWSISMRLLVLYGHICRSGKVRFLGCLMRLG